MSPFIPFLSYILLSFFLSSPSTPLYLFYTLSSPPSVPPPSCPVPPSLHLLPLFSPSFIWLKLNVLCEITSQQEIPPVLPDCSVFSPGLATMCVLHKCLCSTQDLHSSPVSPVKRPRRAKPNAALQAPEPQHLVGRITAKTLKSPPCNLTFTYKTPDIYRHHQRKLSFVTICGAVQHLSGLFKKPFQKVIFSLNSFKGRLPEASAGSMSTSQQRLKRSLRPATKYSRT